MAFTREFIRKTAKESGVEIPKELEDALINEHLSARDIFAEGKVKTALEENAPAPQNVKDTKEYKELKKSFDDYKAEQEGKEASAAKKAAALAYYKSKGITDKALDIAMRGSAAEVEALELDGGKIKDTKPLDDLITGVFSGLVGKTEVFGAGTANPPAGNGSTMTRADIYKKDDNGRYVLSASERQKALIENKIV